MIKVVVVEDEPLMNQFIVGSIEWNKLGLDLCGVFYNGKSAFEFLKDNPADIVVTDIQMPIMNGLTLISKVLEIYPETKFIALSNFDEFDMVKNAFKLGVTDYVLKTDFEAETFQKILMDITGRLISSDKTDMLSLNIKEYSLKQFFWSNTPIADVTRKIRINTEGPLTVALLKLLNYDEMLKDSWDMEKELMKFGLSNCLEEILENNGSGEFFFNGYDEIIFLFSDIDKTSCCNNAGEIFEKIFEFLTQNFGLVSAAAICDIYDCHDLKEQYHLVSQSIGFSFVMGNDRLIFCSQAANFTDVPDVNDISAKIDGFLANMDFEAIPNVLDEIKRPAYISIPAIRDMYKKLLGKLKDIYAEYEFSDEISGIDEIDINYSSMPEINKLINQICSFLASKFEYSDVIIVQVENYIRKNYSSDLSLQLLAKQFLFSYTDLSRRFQKATGMSFSKFLKEVRLTEAMKFIKTTDFKCSQISSMVGYNNYENFSRAFKEKYQKTPNEVRRGGKA